MKANAKLQKALKRFRDQQSKKFEPRRTTATAVITSVERDPVTGHTTGNVRATIDGVADQDVFVGSGQGFSVGSTVRVENRGGSFSPDWTLLGRVGSVAGQEGTLDIDRTLSTPTGVSLSTDAYTPVAGAGLFSSVTVTFNQNQEYESVASYDVQWFKDSEGSSTAEIVNVPHVVGENTNLAVIGGLLPEQTYSFRVRAKAFSGAVGGWTDYSSIETATDATAPSTPTGLSAEAIDDYTLRLYWTPNSEPDFAYYVLDVSATNSTAGRISGYPRTVGNQPEFVLGVSPNVPRYFAVKAVDATGNESAYSSFSGPYQTEDLPSGAGLFYWGPTVELVASLSSGATSMDVNHNILEAGWFLHIISSAGDGEIVQVNTSTPGGSAVSNGDGYRYNIVREQAGTTARAFAKGTTCYALTKAGYIQSDVREDEADRPFIKIYEWDDPYTNNWADRSLRVVLGNLNSITDPDMGALSGYGLYSDNVYLNGQIRAQGGAILGSIAIDGGDITGGGVTIGDSGITIDSDDTDWISWKNGATNIGAVTANVSGTTHKLGIAAFNDTGAETVSTRIEITSNQASSYVNILEDDVDVDFQGLRIGLVGGAPEEMLDVRGNAYIAGDILAATTGQDIGSAVTKWNALYVENLYADSVVGTPSGLEIGVDVQAWDADLDAIAALAKTDGNIIVGNGTTWVAESGATARTSLGLAIGTNVQAWDADLDAIAALAKTDGNIIVGNGTTWVAESGNTARTSLALGTSNSPTFAGLTINGNITVTGNVDGVDVSAHASRHESGGADAVNHDSLTGFVADEHVAHSGVTLTAGNGLSGGGTIAASRSFAVNLDYDFNWTGLHTFDDFVELNGGAELNDVDLHVWNSSYPSLPVLYVDASARGIGINRNPDIQFSLDVAGALRAEYLVGPHAIQLDGANLIAHFDGPGPFETNFTGTPQGHKGQIGTEAASTSIIYRPGKFGKAVQVAVATTNCIIDPSFELGAWTYWSLYGTVSRSFDTSKPLYGDAAAKFVNTSATGGVQQTHTTSSGGNWTGSANIYIESLSSRITLYLRVTYTDATYDQSSVNASSSIVGEWQRLIVTQAANAAKTVSSVTVYLALFDGGSGTWYADAVQLENKSYATPYCDGSLGLAPGQAQSDSASGNVVGGHTWNGTAHASTSTRTSSTLTYDIDNIDADEGTVMMWVYLDEPNTSGGLLWAAGNANAEFDAYITSSGGLIFRMNGSTVGGSSTGISSGEWHHVAFTWSISGNTATTYLDGEAVRAGAYSTLVTLGSSIGLGYSPVLTTTYNHPGLIDEFVVTSRAMPANEILSIYESDAPVFAESAVNFFKSYGPSPVEINEEGLYIRNQSNDAILGVFSGNDAGSKSWGGQTLNEGDVLIGRSTNYVLWDDSAGTLNVAAEVEITGNSSITGGLAISGATGYIDLTISGEGKFSVSSDALYLGDNINIGPSAAFVFADNVVMPGGGPGDEQFFSGDVLIGDYLAANMLWDASTGQLKFRNADSTQLYVDTDGGLVAGGGDVILDADGLNLSAGSTSTNRINWDNGSGVIGSISAYVDSGNSRNATWLYGIGDATNNDGFILLEAFRTGASSSDTAYISLESGVTGSGTGEIVIRSPYTIGLIGTEITASSMFGINGRLELQEISTTPASPASGTEGNIYIRNNNLIVQWNDGGTVRYKYLPLTGTSVTWTHTTTAP